MGKQLSAAQLESKTTRLQGPEVGFAAPMSVSSDMSNGAVVGTATSVVARGSARYLAATVPAGLSLNWSTGQVTVSDVSSVNFAVASLSISIFAFDGYRKSSTTESISIAPRNTAVPTITGTAQVGVALTIAAGTFDGAPDAVVTTIQWATTDSGDDADWLNVVGATLPSYTPDAQREQHYLRARSVAVRGGVEYDATVSATAGPVAVAAGANPNLWPWPDFQLPKPAEVDRVDTNWTPGVDGGIYSNGASGNLGMTGGNAPLTVGTSYDVSITCSEIISGQFAFGWTGKSGEWSGYKSTTGTHSFVLTPSGPNVELRIWSSSFEGVLTNFSCVEQGGAASTPAPQLLINIPNPVIQPDAAVGTVVATLSATNPNSAGPPDYIWTVGSNSAFAVTESGDGSTVSVTVTDATNLLALAGTTVNTSVTVDNTEGSPTSTDTGTITFDVAATATDPDELWPQDGLTGLAFDGTAWTLDGGGNYVTPVGVISNMKVATPPATAGISLDWAIDVTKTGTGSLYWAWDGTPNEYEAITATGVYTITKVMIKDGLYLRAAPGGYTVNSISVKATPTPGGGGGGEETGGGTQGPNYATLKARVDQYAGGRNTTWISRQSNNNPLTNTVSGLMTVADGYNRAPAGIGLHEAYKATGDETYLQYLLDAVNEWIDDARYIAGNNPTHLTWYAGEYNPSSSGYHHDHYEFRGSMIVGSCLLALMDNPSSPLSTTANKSKLATHLAAMYDKWKGGVIAGESNINTTSIYMRSRAGLWMLALDQYYGGSTYSGWLADKGAEIVNAIRTQTSGGTANFASRVDGTDQPGTLLSGTTDVSHADDVIPFVMEAYERGYSWVAESDVLALGQALTQVMWKGNGFADNVNGQGAVDTGRYGRNIGEWLPLLRYDNRNLAAIVSWALATYPSSANPREMDLVVFASLMRAGG